MMPPASSARSGRQHASCLRYCALASALLASLAPGRGRCDTVDDFDAPQTGFQIDASGGHRTVEHRRVRDPAGGPDFERIVVDARPGYSVPCRYPIGKTPVIEEVSCRCRVRCNRPGLQLTMRVYFPRSRDARTGEILSTLVYGPRHSTPQRWQSLTIEGIDTLTQRVARVLRTSPGQRVDTREAYVGAVVLLVPGGPGMTTVDIDRLEVTGVQSNVAEDRPPGSNATASDDIAIKPAESIEREPIDVGVEGRTVRVNGHAMLPRLIQYNGEPMQLIAELGFNGIWLDHPPSEDTVLAAERQRLWVVAPPPDDLSEAAQQDSPWRAVLSWHCGRGLRGRHLDTTLAASESIRGHDRQLNRPVCAGSANSLAKLSRIVDILAVPAGDPAGQAGPSLARAMLEASVRESAAHCAVLAEFSLDLPAGLQRQLLRFNVPDARWADPRGLRDEIAHALAGGVRGYVIRSQHSIAGEDLAAQRLRSHLAIANSAVLVAEPWIIRGSKVTDLQTDDQSLSVYMYQLDRLRLCVLASNDDWPRGDGLAETAQPLVIPGVPATAHGYWVSAAAVDSAQLQRRAGGSLVEIPTGHSNAMLLLTDDTRAIKQLNAAANRRGKSAARLVRDAARGDLKALATIHADMPEHRRSVAIRDLLPLARGMLTQCELAIAANDFVRAVNTANEVLHRVEQAHAVLRRQVAASDLTSLPTARLPRTWATHVALREVLPQLPRGGNLLPGGNFEQLADLQRFGWTHTQRHDSSQEAAATLTNVEPHTGTASLRLMTSSNGDQSIDGPALWIESPEISVPNGKLVEITGWVRVVPNDNADVRLQIIDSIAGPDLALTVQSAPQWSPFRLYRMTGDESRLRLTLAISGSGHADIDAVMVRAIEKPDGRVARQQRGMMTRTATGPN